MVINKTISISFKDYLLFNIGLVKKTIITYAIILSVICIAFNGIMNGFNFNQTEFWLKSLIFYGVGLIVLCGYFFALIFFASRKVYIPNKQYYQNMELVIDETGLHQTSSGAESHLTYKQIYNVKENKRTFIVLISPRQGILIPKKNFTNEEILEIRKYLNNRG